MNATAYPATTGYGFPLPWPAVGRRVSPAIDLPRLCRDAVLILALLLTNAAGTPGAVVFFAILSIMVFRSPEAAFKAIAICYLGLMLNTAFVPKSLVWTPARLLIPYLAFIRFTADMTALRQSLFSNRSYVAFLFFSLTMAVCSIASGWCTHIALLKLTNFFVFVTMLFAAATVLRARRSDLGEWFVSMCLATTLLGIGSIVFRVSNNFRPTRTAAGQLIYLGFNGAFCHPNAHATYASLITTFLLIVWILSRYRRSWLTLPMIACWFMFMGWSGSRTSLIASIIASVLLAAYAAPIRNRLGWRIRPNVNRGTLVALGVAAVIAMFVWDVTSGGSIRKTIVSFLNKGTTADAALDTKQIVASRSRLVEFSWQNFQDSPVFGIGFGVAKTEWFKQTATLFTAPVEKGFLPTAILEEGGLLGAAAFLVFVCVMLWEFMRERNVAGLVMFITFLITNVGEVTIFAPGGGGAFGWTMVSAAMIFGDRCWAPPAHRPHPGPARPWEHA